MIFLSDFKAPKSNHCDRGSDGEGGDELEDKTQDSCFIIINTTIFQVIIIIVIINTMIQWQEFCNSRF